VHIVVPKQHSSNQSINKMAYAFLADNLPEKMAELNQEATKQLRQKLTPEDRKKWRRLKAIANLVNSQN
jgi:L-lactate utilization protein LutB